MRQYRQMRVHKAAITLLILAFLPAVGSGGPDRVTFLRRHIAVVCAGVCPYFEVSVARDGTVTERFFKYWEGNRDVVRNERRFQISHADAAAFFREFAPFRPVGRKQFGQRCYPEIPLDDPSINHQLGEYEVRWANKGRADRLDACGRDASLRRAANRALLDISIDPHSGRFLTGAMRRWWTECVAETDLQRC